MKKRPKKSSERKLKCPECGRMTDGVSAHKNGKRECYMVVDRRGGWRQLGVYDG